jgi:hypothetical protein
MADPNINGQAYALTILSPIRPGHVGEVSFGNMVHQQLEGWNMRENSPMVHVPQTYLARFFVLDDVFIESQQGGGAPDTVNDWLPIVPDFLRRWMQPSQDHLQSRYLVFSSNFHGALDDYLRGMWRAIEQDVRSVWQYCYAFEDVRDEAGFVAYMKRCQLDASLFFVGSNDDPLDEQLKALYLKQEFSRFAAESQGLPTAELKLRFREFIARVQPTDLKGPSWEPGQYRLPKIGDSQQEPAL